MSALTLLAGGCSTKPPRDVDAAVRHRLTRYSDAWKQGDANGVRDSFAPRDANEEALLDAISELAPAQAKLRSAYSQSLSPERPHHLRRRRSDDAGLRHAAVGVVRAVRRPSVQSRLQKADRARAACGE
jgi:hypothetical protein